MARVLWRGAVAIAAFLVLAIPALGSFGSDSSTGSDPVTITKYVATYDVSKDGTLTATEKITAEFPSDRHGIFRFWDVDDSANPHVRYVPKDIDVTMDGHDEPTNLQWEQGRRFRVAKIGDPDTTLSAGTHEYTISYTIDGALAGLTEGRSRFNWSVVAAGWRMPINRAEITVKLPDAARSVVAAVLPRNAPEQTLQPNVDGSTITLSAGNLAPNTPVHLVANVAVAPPGQVTVPWRIELDRALGHSVPVVVLFGVLAVASAALAYAADRRSVESEPPLPIVFDPPQGFGPVQSYYVVNEKSPERNLVCTLLHLAETGAVTLSQNDGDWTVTGTGRTEQLDVVSSALARKLGVDSEGGTFTADGSVSAGRTLSAARSSVEGATTSWGRTEGLVMRSAFESLTKLAVIAAIVITGLGVFWLGITSIYLLPFAAFAVGGACLLLGGVGTRRTAAGREAWSHAGGFARFLSTDGSKDRFDFSGRQQLYTQFIPYAVAFGVAERWAQKYQMSMGTEPPVPVWLPYNSSSGHGFAALSSIDTFDSSLNSAISAYSATQSSSSGGGGGGGFSGGGGGGGGGSW